MAVLRVSRNDLCPCGSGIKFKKCCLHKKQEGSIFEGAEGFNPRPIYSDGATLSAHAPKPRPKMQAIQRVTVSYTFPEPFGEANVEYAFPVERLIMLCGGMVTEVQDLEVGTKFVMQSGQIATVTSIDQPEWWEPPCDRPVKGNLYERRVIGRVEHIGNVVMDLTVKGEIITTTPDHLFWSATRNIYIPAGQLIIGELFQTAEGTTARLDAISPPRYGLVKLYNLEIEDFHNYFVGKAGIKVHNGLPGACGVPTPLEVAEAEVGVKAYKKGWPGEVVVDHRLSRAVAKVFGGDPHAPSNLVLEAFEANARKGSREGQVLSAYYEYVRQGLAPENALEVLRPEVHSIINDVHARPVDPNVFRKVAAGGS